MKLSYFLISSGAERSREWIKFNFFLQSTVEKVGQLNVTCKRVTCKQTLKLFQFLTVRVSRTVLQVCKLLLLLGILYLWSKWLLTSQWLITVASNVLKSLRKSQKVPKFSKHPKSIKQSQKVSNSLKSFKKSQNVPNLTVMHWKPFQSRSLRNSEYIFYRSKLLWVAVHVLAQIRYSVDVSR